MSNVTIEKQGRRHVAVGDTFQVKALLKEHGFRWDSAEYYWWTGSAENAEEARAAIAALAGFVPVEIEGNTYAMREELKAAGCVFDRERRAWTAMTPQAAEEAQRIMAMAPRQRPVSLATDKQLSALRNMLGRLDNVGRLDSFHDSGASHADSIRDEIERLGGFDDLTRKQASEFLGQVSGLIDDEM